MITPRVAHVFFDVDMRAGHDGLAVVASKAGKNLAKVSPGDFLVFISRDQHRLKILTPVEGETDKGYGLLCSYRSPRGRIMLSAIAHLPRAFGRGGFQMSNAIRSALVDKLKKEKR